MRELVAGQLTEWSAFQEWSHLTYESRHTLFAVQSADICLRPVSNYVSRMKVCLSSECASYHVAELTNIDPRVVYVCLV